MKQRIKVEGSCLDYVWRQTATIEMKVMQNGLILSFPDADVLVNWGGWLCEGDDGTWYAEGGEESADERIKRYIPKQMKLPKRGDIIRITNVGELAKIHHAKLKEGDICKVISSWKYELPEDNKCYRMFVRIKYPDGKRKNSPIRSHVYEWEIIKQSEELSYE